MAEKEYVERDELESRIKKYVKCRDADRETLEWAKDECIRQAHCMPAADVVEVVRCKDCKYWKQVTAERHACCMIGFEMDYDEYCSYGERKDDGE